MRAVVQRVSRASVRVDGETVGEIARGLCVLVGVMEGDGPPEAKQLAQKVASLRVFSDEDDKMNLSVKDVGGAVLAVSQFTLAGDVRKGNRPSFISAMAPDPARALFEEFCEAVRALDVPVETGRFRAHMSVELENDGPVTILVDTQRTF
jgi:D-tyrosyl-tRNA(Tyr) deacylase